MDKIQAENPQPARGTAREPGNPVLLLSGIGFVAMLFIFLVIVYYSYWPNRPLPVDKARVAERTVYLREVQQKQAHAASTYDWVDQEAGIVRIPIERAMELTVRSLNESEKQTGGGS